MKFYHVDVFSKVPLRGNGLTVAFPTRSYPAQELLAITQELKQFETIFVDPRTADGSYPARIFTVSEEICFAGHPILGAGAVVHRVFYQKQEDASFPFLLGERQVNVRSQKRDDHYLVSMDQGSATFINTVAAAQYGEIAEAFGLQKSDIDSDFPVEVVSTGLPFLLVPLRSGLSACRIMRNNFGDFLGRFSAKFAYVFDTKTLECRAWDTHSHIEDVATGSAAGPLCAYLVKNGVKQCDEVIEINQGRFLNRPSVIQSQVTDDGCGNVAVSISGEVSFFSSGSIDIGL